MCPGPRARCGQGAPRAHCAVAYRLGARGHSSLPTQRRTGRWGSPHTRLVTLDKSLPRTGLGSGEQLWSPVFPGPGQPRARDSAHGPGVKAGTYIAGWPSSLPLGTWPCWGSSHKAQAGSPGVGGHRSSGVARPAVWALGLLCSLALLAAGQIPYPGMGRLPRAAHGMPLTTAIVASSRAGDGSPEGRVCPRIKPPVTLSPCL